MNKIWNPGAICLILLLLAFSRWQQLLIDNFVGYDTILMNSLLNAKGNGNHHPSTSFNFWLRSIITTLLVNNYDGFRSLSPGQCMI